MNLKEIKNTQNECKERKERKKNIFKEEILKKKTKKKHCDAWCIAPPKYVVEDYIIK